MSKGKEALHQIGILNIPTKLSIPADPKSTQNEPGMCKGVIGPGSCLGIKFTVTEPNMELNWNIKPKSGPVKLGIHRCPIQDEDTMANGTDQNQQELLRALCYTKENAEEIERPKLISRSKKSFVQGGIRCDPDASFSGFIYTVSISNANFFPKSINVYYNVYLIHTDQKKNTESIEEKVFSNEDCLNMHLLEDSDERNACIKDLLAFVGEITQAEYGLNNSRLTKKRGKRKDGKDETKFKENVRVEQEKATVKEDKEGSTEVCDEKIDLKNKQTEALVNKVTEVFLEAN